MPPSTSRRALVGLAVVVVVAVGALSSPATAFATLESVADDPYLFGLLVAGLYLARPLLVWPTTPLSVVVGYGYGVALGVPIALCGVVLTVLPVFLAVRWAADGTTAETGIGVGPLESALELAGDAVARYYATTGPLRGVVVSRLAPIPSDVSTAAAAVSDVELRHLVVGTAIGELPWTVAGVVVGASAATVATAGVGDLGVTLSVACTLAAAVLLAGPAYRLARGRLVRPQSG